MTDIVARLAQLAENDMKAKGIALDAKHTIEELRKDVTAFWNEMELMRSDLSIYAEEIERIRKALRILSEFDANPSGSGTAYGQCGEMVRLARSALQQKESE